MADIVRRYRTEPTASKFHKNPCNVRGILGPIGSGKSVACCLEIGAVRATKQIPNKYGIRKTRWAIVRNTYGELKSTTIKTWEHWWPSSVCKIVYDTPIRGLLKYDLPDGTKVHCEIYFLSLDKPKDCAKVLSLELTGVWINEAREIDFSIVEACESRTGRYPSKEECGLTWSGVIMDTNPPDNDHWWYKYAEENTPKNWAFYHQPPALLYDKDKNLYYPNPKAENIRNLQLGYDYWLRLWKGDNHDFMKVYCLGDYGYVQDGRPVYPEYQDSLHYCAEIPACEDLPFVLGFDFGLTPAAIISQYYPGFHQIKWLEEWVSKSMGLKQFLKNVLIPSIRRNYPMIKDLSEIVVVGDPAGNQRAQTDETTCMDILKSFGFKPRNGRTNDILPRLEAMKDFMTRITPNGPAFQVSSKCNTFRKGLMGKYKFDRMQITGKELYRDKPSKDIYSHVQDGAQYVAMECEGGDVKSNKSANSGAWDKIGKAGSM